MTDTPPTEPTESSDAASEFERAGSAPRQSLIGEFFEFLKEDGKWWMMPIVVVLGLLGVLMLVGNSAAPWIYALF